jgi:hypothetical protein
MMTETTPTAPRLLYLHDSPYRTRPWAVHESVFDLEGVDRRIIFGHYSLQPLRVVKMLLRNDGIGKSERGRIIDAASRYTTSFDDLKDI